jgi:hypothetical protein
VVCLRAVTCGVVWEASYLVSILEPLKRLLHIPESSASVSACTCEESSVVVREWEKEPTCNVSVFFIFFEHSQPTGDRLRSLLITLRSCVLMA